MIARPLVILLLQSLFRCAVRRIEEIWNSTCHASEENNGTSGMRQSASNGFPGRGGIFVPGGTGDIESPLGLNELLVHRPAGTERDAILAAAFSPPLPRTLFRRTCPPCGSPGNGKYMKSSPKTGRPLTPRPPKGKENICIEKKYDCFFDIFPLFCRAAIFRPLYRNCAGTAAAGSPKPGPPATCIRAWLRKRRPPRLRTPAPSQCT